jgi:hypothetical protein
MSRAKAKRDIPKEQALVREKWQLVHANIKLDEALHAFLTQSLDQGGITIAKAAFELVHKILNPKGYVRLEHKAELTNIGSLIREPDSAWMQQGKHIHTRWDFLDVWWGKNNDWASIDEYKPLKLDAVDQFCKELQVQAIDRKLNAKYTNIKDDLDKDFSLQQLDDSQKFVDKFEQLPVNNTVKPVRRWETKCHEFSKTDILDKYTNAAWTELQDNQKILEPYWRLALRINKWQKTNEKQEEESKEDTDAPIDNQDASQADDDAAGLLLPQMEFESILHLPQELTIATAGDLTLDDLKNLAKTQDLNKEKCEDLGKNTYKPILVADWRNFLKANGQTISGNKSDLILRTWHFIKNKSDDALANLKFTTGNDTKKKRASKGGGAGGGSGASGILRKIHDEYGYWTKHRTCRHVDKADLVLKVGYFSEDTGLYTQRIVFAEIDGHDKTHRPSGPDDTDSIKLAEKLMSSTSVQAVLQPETYHIRSNLSEYLCDEIQRSLFSTTNVEVPDFKEFISSLQNDSSKKTDLMKFQEAIHWVHHLFLAHVKVAFLIHMREMHDIDMLSSDIRDARMQDHYFFINFTGHHLPNELVFQDRIDATTKTWLESKLMLLTRPKIKCFEEESSKWKYAPVVNASSKHASMHEWTAQVRSIPVPEFPYEESSFMPIACATVQRVNMPKLCEIVKAAARSADEAYLDARRLQKRDKETILSRKFPDRCFLTRRQQFNRNSWWNQGDDKLRQCCTNIAQEDKLEFNWGYETPERKRSYKEFDKKWDQIDVRMHFFDQEMQKTEWKDAANGMWFIQDYVDFMSMLKQLTVSFDPDNTCTAKADDQLPNFEVRHTLPHRFEVNDRACHCFSVLSWFFDCRDAGACRYRWEDWVLDYFGAYIAQKNTDSDFHTFMHVEKLPETQWPYFKNRWFEIVLFLEQNFRNAIAPMHHMLFEFENAKHKETDKLQLDAKLMYNRRTSIVNNRSVFAGLQVGNANGSSLLSFRRYDPITNPNMTLRERVMSQLHDELPDLDPFLKKYIRQFRIPDAELFLRMIRCPNVLALRELAIQHRHLLGGQNTASSVQPQNKENKGDSSQPPYHLQQTLKYFPIAVQSEILYMLKFVEGDDSVYVHAPAIHETKLMLVPQDLMRQWIRKTLDVAVRVLALKTPLQMKCYMFVMQELAGHGVGAFHTLKKLFYTTEAMMNYETKRGIVFVLLQVRLVLLTLKQGAQKRSNPLVDLFGITLDVDTETEYQTKVWQNRDDPILWRPGTCLESWPLRDQNQYQLPSKNYFVDIAVSDIQTSAPVFNVMPQILESPNHHEVFGDKRPVNFVYTMPGTDINEDNDMREHERRLWMLLMYARPCLQHFTAEDYTSVCQKLFSEYASLPTKDTIVAKLQYQMQENRLKCIIEDDVETPLFFEKIQKPSEAHCREFPVLVKAIISKNPSRTCIYIPKAFAIDLRKQCSRQQPLHSQFFTHDGSTWKMVCVGVRHWAWKRLLVKSVFFDAFAKSMTRSSVQLSLYGPELQLEEQLQAHQLTSSVFGDLQYKTDLLKKNNMKKQVQLVFTVFEKKRRQGKIENITTTFDEKKIPSITRQIEFVRHCQSHFNEIKAKRSCRYMRVDSRIVDKFLEQKEVQHLDGNQIVYRSYLYQNTESTHMLVKFRNEIYIKFPTDYAIIRHDADAYKIGVIKISSKEHKYATCFDTRTYSCAKPKLQRKADSIEFMHMIQECTDTPKSNFDQQSWPSTKELTDGSKSWIYKENRKVMLCKDVSPVIDHTLAQKFTTEDQENMYTLPDYFSTEQDKVKDIESKCQPPEIANPHPWTTDISNWPQDSTIVDKWISLRCTTKTIAYQNKILVQNDDNIDHDVLKPMLRKIRNSIKTPSYIDTELNN